MFNFFKKKPSYYLSLCVISKNQGPYLIEWIEYHRMLGVDHFYFYDNNSTDNTRYLLSYYMNKRILDYVFFSPHPGQLLAYMDCIKKHKESNQWIGFIDMDEFIVPIASKNIRDFLRNYEGSNGLGINWINYGSSGYKEKPQGLQLETFVCHSKQDFGVNKHIKSIVDPNRVLNVSSNPHYFIFKDDGFVRDEDGELIVSGAFSKVNKSQKIRINHYALRSESEFRDKMARGRATIKASHPWQLFLAHDRNDIKDDIMCQYIPELKKRIGLVEKEIEL
ncbi:MAG: glycosyltransferase family 92 protein [Candidatus Omnitrophica bacterium]|nr:glycosyltransferase family 92 protein [Candidatus Omnitrophota bacterium]